MPEVADGPDTNVGGSRTTGSSASIASGTNFTWRMAVGQVMNSVTRTGPLWFPPACGGETATAGGNAEQRPSAPRLG